MFFKSLKRRLSRLKATHSEDGSLTKVGLERMTDEELSAVIEAADSLRSQGGKI